MKHVILRFQHQRRPLLFHSVFAAPNLSIQRWWLDIDELLIYVKLLSLRHARKINLITIWGQISIFPLQCVAKQSNDPAWYLLLHGKNGWDISELEGGVALSCSNKAMLSCSFSGASIKIPLVKRWPCEIPNLKHVILRFQHQLRGWGWRCLGRTKQC